MCASCKDDTSDLSPRQVVNKKEDGENHRAISGMKA